MQSSMEDHMNKIINGMYSISFYSPIIVLIAVIYWGFSINASIKSFIYLAIVLFISLIRWGVMFNKSDSAIIPTIPATNIECSKMLIPEDPLYSSYIISFTLFYLLIPMIMLSNEAKFGLYNFSVLIFFIVYMVYDIVIKSSIKCIDVTNIKFVINLLTGAGFGAGFGMLFYTYAKSFLFINEQQTNDEVCNMPAKQQFKCRLYKNGQLVTK